MANGTMTYEEVERLAERVPDASGARDVGANPIQKFCAVWPMLRGVLQMARVFFPQKVREKIDAAVTVCDGICPSGVQ